MSVHVCRCGRGVAHSKLRAAADKLHATHAMSEKKRLNIMTECLSPQNRSIRARLGVDKLERLLGDCGKPVTSLSVESADFLSFEVIVIASSYENIHDLRGAKATLSNYRGREPWRIHRVERWGSEGDPLSRKRHRPGRR